MFQELIKSFLLIFMAEMGDKTQILALAFATQFKASKVLIGVFIGVLFNHALAIILGIYISKLISIDILQLIAGVSFMIFSLWTLKVDEDDEEEENTNKDYGPILTVAIAFFLGELGDKTQLTAITLSVDSNYPLFVLMGTVLGMILTSGVGIFVGSKLGKRVPEFTIKIIASLIFLAFGLQKLYTTIDRDYLNVITIVLFLTVITAAYSLLLRRTIAIKNEGKLSNLQKKSERLYNLNNSIKEVCLGEDICKTCDGKRCRVGYSKLLLKNEIENEGTDMGNFQNFDSNPKKKYDRERIIESLGATLLYLMTLSQDEDEKSIIHEVRKSLEEMLFNESFEYPGDMEEYLTILSKKDVDLVKNLKEIIRKSK